MHQEAGVGDAPIVRPQPQPAVVAQQPAVVERYVRHVDNGSPYLHVCLRQIKASSASALARLEVKFEGNIKHYHFLHDVCNRAAARLTKKYQALSLAQMKVISESFLRELGTESLEEAEHRSHDAHYIFEVITAIVHRIEGQLTAAAAAVAAVTASAAHVVAIAAIMGALLLKFLAHNLKHQAVAAHPAALLKDLETIDFAVVFKAICVDVVLAWSENIPAMAASANAHTEKWVEKLTFNIEQSFSLLGKTHSNISLHDVFERIVALTKNQQRQLSMTQKTYLVSDYPMVVAVHKILQGHTSSNDKHRIIDDTVGRNLRRNRQITGRFLLDVLDVFLKPYKGVAVRNKAMSIIFFAYLASSVDNLRKCYDRTAHALSYVSQNLINTRAQANIANYAFQKYLIDTLIFNFLEDSSRLDIEWCQEIKRIYFQHKGAFHPTTLDYQVGARSFIVHSHADLLQVGTIDDLQATIRIKDIEINTLNGRLGASNRALRASEAAKGVLEAKKAAQAKTIKALEANEKLLLKELAALKKSKPVSDKAPPANAFGRK